MSSPTTSLIGKPRTSSPKTPGHSVLKILRPPSSEEPKTSNKTKVSPSKSSSRNTPKSSKVPPALLLNNSPNYALTQSPLTAVWTNRAGGTYPKPVSPKTWRVSPASINQWQKLVAQEAFDYTPEKDPLFREPVVRRNGTIGLEVEQKPPFQTYRKKVEDPILISMRIQTKENDHLDETDGQKPVKLLRQMFENRATTDGNALDNMEDADSRNREKNRHRQRKSTKRSHTVIGLDYQVEVNNSNIIKTRDAEILRRKSFSENGVVRDDYVMPSVRSLLQRFETGRKQEALKNLTGTSEEKPEKLVSSVIQSSCNETTALSKCLSSFNESSVTESTTSISVQKSTDVTTYYDQSDDRDRDDLLKTEENFGTFERSSRRRSSVKDLRKRFESFKESKIINQENIQNTSEKSEEIPRKKLLMLPDQAFGDASCSTPKKPAEEDKLIPAEVILSDDNGPISPIAVETINYDTEVFKTPNTVVDAFTRGSPNRSSVKDLLKRFEASGRKKDVFNDVTHLAMETTTVQTVNLNEGSVHKEISSVLVNPTLRSESVQKVKQIFLEQTFTKKIEHTVEITKINIYNEDELDNSSVSSQSTRNTSKIIGMFENKDSGNSSYESYKSVKAVNKLDMSKFTKTYAKETSINSEESVGVLTLPSGNSSYESSKWVKAVNKLDMSKYTKSYTKETSINSEESDEEAPALPQVPPPINKLDINKFTASLAKDYENEESISTKEKSSVNKLNIEEFSAALSHSKSDHVLDTTVDHEVVQKETVSNLVDQFASSLPNFMTGVSEGRRYSEPSDATRLKVETTNDSEKSLDTPAIKEISMNIPGKIRPLTSSELKYFTNDSGKEEDLLSALKNISNVKRVVAASPQLQRVKNGDQPFERSRSLKLPKNCRELNADEKSLFFGGNVTSAFMKSTGVQRSSSDVSELSSHKKNLIPRSDFRYRGKGNEQMSEIMLYLTKNSDSFKTESGLDSSIIREEYNISTAYLGLDICATSSPKLNRSLSDSSSNNSSSLDYMKIKSGPPQTFDYASFAPFLEHAYTEHIIENITDGSGLSYLSDSDELPGMTVNKLIKKSTEAKPDEETIVKKYRQKNAADIIEDIKIKANKTAQSNASESVMSHIHSNIDELKAQCETSASDNFPLLTNDAEVDRRLSTNFYTNVSLLESNNDVQHTETTIEQIATSDNKTKATSIFPCSVRESLNLDKPVLLEVKPKEFSRIQNGPGDDAELNGTKTSSGISFVESGRNCSVLECARIERVNPLLKLGAEATRSTRQQAAAGGEAASTLRSAQAEDKAAELTTKPAELPTKPAELTTKPAELTTKPAELTTKPAEHTTKPAEPTTRPAEPTIKPAEPTTKPAEPTTKPAEPTTKPAEPTTKPAEPTTKPAEPTTKPAELQSKAVNGCTELKSSLGKKFTSSNSEAKREQLDSRKQSEPSENITTSIEARGNADETKPSHKNPWTTIQTSIKKSTATPIGLTKSASNPTEQAQNKQGNCCFPVGSTSNKARKSAQQPDKKVKTKGNITMGEADRSDVEESEKSATEQLSPTSTLPFDEYSLIRIISFILWTMVVMYVLSYFSAQV